MGRWTPASNSASRETARPCAWTSDRTRGNLIVSSKPSERLAAVGVDGAPGGWVGAAAFTEADAASPSRTELHFWDRIGALAEWREKLPGADAAPVAVDIPIGLPTVTEYRPCDQVAKDRLPGSRKSSVFMPPGRYLLAATAPVDGRAPTANEVFKRVQELVRESSEEVAKAGPGHAAAPKVRGFSRQGSGILLKIAEVDAFLRVSGSSGSKGSRQDWLFEVHPEMCFQVMNGGTAPPPKASAQGQLQRLDLVTKQFPDAVERIRTWPSGSRYSLIDICDAYAALWTALRWKQHKTGAAREELDPPLEVLGEDAPGQSPVDKATGLLMRMVV